jgi:hypothetical protein
MVRSIAIIGTSPNRAWSISAPTHAPLSLAPPVPATTPGNPRWEPSPPSPTLALRPNATLSSPASARAPAPFFWDKVLLLGNEGSFKTLYLLSRSSFDPCFLTPVR